jgi:hypothetical protein
MGCRAYGSAIENSNDARVCHWCSMAEMIFVTGFALDKTVSEIYLGGRKTASDST